MTLAAKRPVIRVVDVVQSFRFAMSGSQLRGTAITAKEARRDDAMCHTSAIEPPVLYRSCHCSQPKQAMPTGCV